MMWTEAGTCCCSEEMETSEKADVQQSADTLKTAARKSALF